MKLSHENTNDAVEEIILNTKISEFNQLPLKYRRTITIYALNDEQFDFQTVYYFSEYLPALLIDYEEKKISSKDLIDSLLDYTTKQITDKLSSIYEQKIYNLYDQGLIAWPKDWDKNEPHNPDYYIN